MISKIYSNTDIILAIQKELNEKNMVVLDGVLDINDLLARIGSPTFVKNYVPNKYSFNVSKKYNFKDKELIKFISKITGFNVVSKKIYLFEHGDYTIRNDDDVNYAGYDVYFFLTNRNLTWDESFGGTINYIYENSESRLFIPSSNRLCIVKRDKDAQSFVKYVNARAKNRSFIMLKFGFPKP